MLIVGNRRIESKASRVQLPDIAQLSDNQAVLLDALLRGDDHAKLDTYTRVGRRGRSCRDRALRYSDVPADLIVYGTGL